MFDIQQGKALSRKRDKGIRPRPFLRTANVLWGHIDLRTLDYMDFTPEEEKKYALQQGDLLVCEGGEIGRTAIWEGQISGVYYQNHLHRLRRKAENIEPLFYMYWFQAALTLLGLYRGTGNKTTIPNLSRTRLAAFPIPLPPLPEQRAIAYVLRTVQRAKEATEQVIAAARELKKSLMRHLFTYGPVPVDRADAVEMQETEIGPLPTHWRVVRLGEVMSLRRGTVLPSEVPHSRYVGLEHLDSGEVLIQRFGYAAETSSAKAIFQQGDILYGKLRPYLDKAALAEWSGVCSTDILVLIPKKIAPLFAAYLMHSSYVLQHAIATTTGVNHPRTSWKALAQALIPLPPLAEQREIARMLQVVDEKIRAEEARKAALEALFKTLLHDLMTAKRRLPAEFVARFKEGSSNE
uniref:restriction endonuclease subunit S n=1 Tax=Thermus thermophilus TaxID=274 RepID=UPI001951F11B|nr:restriction endonuclease subunit S [Thermus thermophilus]